MNSTEFIDSVVSSYPSLDNPAFIKLFLEFCHSFKESDYQRIYHQFNRTKLYGAVPKIQDFYQAARDLGVSEKINQNMKYSAFKCNDCGTLWEGEGHCPTCKQCTAMSLLMSETPIPNVSRGVPIGTPVRGDVFLETFENLIKAKSLKNKGGVM